jgi:alcohol dehydrogenase YqhD (iron-dependent ADH family)
MLNFDFDAPTKIYFGKGQIEKLAQAIKLHGHKVLLAYGGGSIKKNGIYDEVVRELTQNNIEFAELSGIKPNPSIDSVREGVKLCREHQVDFILAVGGGSVIDCSKAISVGVDYQGDPWDFFSAGAKVGKVLPVGSVLTLSATGSEMNGNSVISNEKTEEKLPLNNPKIRPVFSILDPSYSYSVSPYQTAAGTADIISHCLEQYFSLAKETFVQDRLTEAIIKSCIYYGPVAMKEPGNYEARANLMWASTLALNGLLQTGKIGDWATHVMEHKVSAVSDLTHGVGLAIITPHWMQKVLDDDSICKFISLGRNVFSLEDRVDKMSLAKETIAAFKSFFNSLGIASTLYETGIRLTDQKIIEMAKDITSNGPIGKFRALDFEKVRAILQSSYQ